MSPTETPFFKVCISRSAVMDGCVDYVVNAVQQEGIVKADHKPLCPLW